jgi:hypothetical protein
MKKLFIIICLLGMAGLARAADSSVEEKVKSIRAHYSEIESSLKRLTRVKREVLDESTEGGELIGYIKDSSLRKIRATFYGEMGKTLKEYYFWDNQLIFVLRVTFRYNKPLSGVVKTKTEERFYFADGSLIRWLDAQAKDMTASTEKPARERDLLADAKKYSALIVQQE